MGKLINEIINNPDKIYLISQLGGGLANRYKIYEEVVRPGLVKLLPYKNVKFLFPLK